MNIENKAKPENNRHGPLWAELQEKAKDNPQLAKQLEAAKRVMERYRETLQRLADS